MHSAAIIPFRPPALPALGFRVDVQEFDHQAIVILFQNRTIASQTPFRDRAAANQYARELACDHRCSVVHHRHLNLRHHAANSCDCLSCQTARPDYPCLIEDDQ